MARLALLILRRWFILSLQLSHASAIHEVGSGVLHRVHRPASIRFKV